MCPPASFLTAGVLAGAIALGACTGAGSGQSDQSDQASTSADALGLGKWELREGPRGATPTYPLEAYGHLPSVWGIDPPPLLGSDGFNAEVFRRYGLFPADFDNDGLPLGLLKSSSTLNGSPGIVTACEFCHSVSLFGRVMIGVPNPFANMERFYRDLALAAGQTPRGYPFEFNPAGNSMINAADQFAMLGLWLRNPTDPKSADLEPALDVTEGLRFKVDPSSYRQDAFAKAAFLKVPAWFNFAVKQASPGAAYYADGGESKDANFAAFTYMLTFNSKRDGSDLAEGLKNWKARAPAYLKTLRAPAYPFPIDRTSATRGLAVYNGACASCHGQASVTPGRNESVVAYPGKIVEVADVGTDPLRAQLPQEFVDRIQSVLRETYTSTYDPSNPGHEGYVAQPLNGIWARSPYLHNGSVPTLAQLLDSSTRIARYAMTANPNNVGDYDQAQIGWKVSAAEDVQSDEFTRIYDASKVPGLTNTGHTYGDALADGDRTDLLEFLKTL